MEGLLTLGYIFVFARIVDQGARLVDKELALRTKEFAKVVAHKSPHMQALIQYILYSSFGKLIMKWHLRAVGILRIIRLFYISKHVGTSKHFI